MEQLSEEQQRAEREIADFNANVLPYGYLDVKAGIEHFLRYDKTGFNLAEAVEQFSEDIGAPLKDIDVTYVAYDVVLQEVRNEISDLIGFDICNDADFFTYGNFLCSTYDHSEQGKEKLITAIAEAEEGKREELLNNEIVEKFLEDVQISQDDINEKIKERGNFRKWNKYR
jgi:hypothetical protein